MVDTELLEEKIALSGKTKKYLAGKLGVSAQTLRLKMINKLDFSTNQAVILCDELGITKLSDRDKIFFKK